MKFRYWLSIVIIIIIICASLCASSTATPPPVFLNAQNKGLKGQRPVPKGPAPGKNPSLPVKGPASVKDIGQKCKAGDEYCVYAGVSQATCMASWCVPPPRNGDPCKYTDKNCVKAKAPMVATVQGGGGCVDTSAEKCDPSRQCVHYTCKTPEDAKRMKVTLDKNEMNFTCGKTDTHVFHCKTVGNTTFCGCGWMRPEDNGGKCPPGMVVKQWSGSSSCSPRLEHTTLRNGKPGACTKDLRQYSFCAMPPQPQADGTGFENCVVTRFDDNCKSNSPCVNYTCKTPEDAQRIISDNVNIKCDKGGERGEYDVLQCKTVDNVTYCGCAPLLANGGVCPAGFVPKTMSTSNGPRKNYTLCVPPS